MHSQPLAVQINETETAGYKIRTYRWENFVITMLLPGSYIGENPEFRPGKVEHEENGASKTVWKFSRAEGSRMIAKLVDVNDEVVIAYVEHKKLVDVLPLRDMPKTVLVKVGDYLIRTGGRDAKKQIELKRECASILGCDVALTQIEERIAKAIDNDRRKQSLEKYEQERAEREKERQARALEREERKSRIMRRVMVVGYDENDRMLRGTPVVGEEYMVLPSGKSAITVESYNDETGEYTKVSEHFFVKKEPGGRTTKGSLVPISDTRKSQSGAVDALGTEAFQVGNDYVIATVVKKKEDVETLSSSGLNSGSKVAVRGKDGFELYSLSKDKVTKLDGVYKPI